VHYLTAVHYVGGRGEANIESVRWLNSVDGVSKTSTVAAMVVWLGRGNTAWVGGAAGKVQVGVVEPSGGRPYLRTHANGEWTDNLRNLPTW
jgi:hypothetical protein